MILYFLERLEKFGYQFGTEDERKAQNVTDQRERGIIVNFENEILEFTRRFHVFYEKEYITYGEEDIPHEEKDINGKNLPPSPIYIQIPKRVR